MSAIVNELNINENATGFMLIRRMPTSLVPVNFLGGEELPKITSNSVRRTQPELQTSLPIHYTIAMAAILKTNEDAPGQMCVR